MGGILGGWRLSLGGAPGAWQHRLRGIKLSALSLSQIGLCSGLQKCVPWLYDPCSSGPPDICS